MKILYHHRTMAKDGMDVHITELVAALRRAGHEVIVTGPAPEAGDGGPASRLRSALPAWLSELLELAYDRIAWRRLVRAYRVHKPDMLYERYNLFLHAGFRLKRRYGVPYLLEVNAPLAHERALHGGLALARLAHWSEGRIWRSADRVLAVSHALAAFLREAGVPEARVAVVPNGVDPRKFSPLADGGPARRELGLGNATILGFTGFMRPWHGLDRVVGLLASEPDMRDMRLLIIGDGPARGAIESEARRLGVEDRVTILGVVGRARIAHYAAAFDIALQPDAVAYASPLKLFEYMALGRAIIAPDQPNIREVLLPGEEALLFTPGDHEAFAAAILRLARDPGLRRRLGAAAAAAIEARGFTWDENARRIGDLAAALLEPVAAAPDRV